MIFLFEIGVDFHCLDAHIFVFVCVFSMVRTEDTFLYHSFPLRPHMFGADDYECCRGLNGAIGCKSRKLTDQEMQERKSGVFRWVSILKFYSNCTVHIAVVCI